MERWRWRWRRNERTLAFFFEGEFALLVVILVFTTTPVFTSLDVSCELCIPWNKYLLAVFREGEVLMLGSLGKSYFSLILRHIDLSNSCRCLIVSGN